MGEAQTDAWKPWTSAADIFNKVFIAGAVLAATLYLTLNKDAFTVSNECSGKIHALMNIVAGKGWQGDTINSIVHYLPEECKEAKTPAGANQLKGLLSALSTYRPSDTNPPPPSGQQQPDTSASGWVAVGFTGTTDFNFSLAGGRALTTTPAEGSILLSRWSVNMRKNPADWNHPQGVLSGGSCFKVSQTRLLPAGAQTQIWAFGTPVPCPSSPTY